MNSKLKTIALCSILPALFSQGAIATYGNQTNQAFDFFTRAGSDWEAFNFLNPGETTEDGETEPGGGGQRFDAEYMFQKYDADTKLLSIGIQAGVDLRDGQIDAFGRVYHGGDLALSFDGVDSNDLANSFEYAVDFGWETQNYDRDTYIDADNNGDGIDQAGLYSVSQWNNDIKHGISSPFAMDEGTLIQAINFTEDTTNEDFIGNQSEVSTSGFDASDQGYGGGYSDGTDYGQYTYQGNTYQYDGIYQGTDYYDLSYYRIVTFSVVGLVADVNNFTVDAHWTMSCGNDNINGNVTHENEDPRPEPVPEPSIAFLFGIGVIGLFASSGMRRKKV